MQDDRTMREGKHSHRRHSLIRVRRPRKPRPETTSASSTAPSPNSLGDGGWIHVFRHIAEYAHDFNDSNHHRAYRHRRRSLIRRSRPGQATVRSPPTSNDDDVELGSDSSRDASPVDKLFPHRRPELIIRRRPRTAATPLPHSNKDALKETNPVWCRSLTRHRHKPPPILATPSHALAQTDPPVGDLIDLSCEKDISESPALIPTDPPVGDLIDFSCNQEHSDSVSNASVVDTLSEFKNYLCIVLDSTPLLPTIVSQPSIPVTPSTSTFTTSLNSALLSSSLHNPQPSPSLHSDSLAIELASGSGNAESELLEKENHASVPAASVASATTLGMAGVTMAETTPPLTLVDPEKSNNRRRRRLQQRKQQLSAPESAPISQRFAPTPIPRRYTPIHSWVS